MCLCDRDTCNGPSLPPREMVDNEEDAINVEDVIKEMNSRNHNGEEARMEPVSSGARTMHIKVEQKGPKGVILLLLLSVMCQ